MQARLHARQLLPIIVLATMAFATHAQTARPGGGGNEQALMQMQQMAAERSALQAEISKLRGDLQKAASERDSFKAAQQQVTRRSRGTEAALAQAVSDQARLEGELAQEKSRVQELVGRLREVATALRDVETEGAQTKNALAARESELRVCVDRNRKLIALNEEVLERFEDQGLWSAIAKREPFTQLKRVELENLADGYRDVARDNRVEPRKP